LNIDVIRIIFESYEKFSSQNEKEKIIMSSNIKPFKTKDLINIWEKRFRGHISEHYIKTKVLLLCKIRVIDVPFIRVCFFFDGWAGGGDNITRIIITILPIDEHISDSNTFDIKIRICYVE